MNRNNSFFQIDESKKIEIFVECQNLINKDILSLSDPYVILKMKKNKINNENEDKTSSESEMWMEVGRTNIVKDNLNPKFTESFILNFIFESYQPILLEVWDYDTASSSEFLGKTQCSLGEIVKQPNQTLTLDLSDQKDKVTYDQNRNSKNGRIIIRYEEVFESNDICLFQFSATNINFSSFSKNLFVRINRKTENTVPLLVYESTLQSNSIKNKIVKLKGQKLCNSDYNVPVIFEIWNRGFFGGDQLLGYFEASVNELKEKTNQNSCSFNLKQDNRKNVIRCNSEQIGSVIFHKTEVIQLPTFLDYLRGGTQINLVLGIDFTGSNGSPSSKDSLHYIQPQVNHKKNQYQQAIYAVGKILLEYDSDKLIPTYGFGAEINGQVKHAFPLNQQQNPELQGIEGVMKAYEIFLKSQMSLSGPTYFAPLIQQCMKQAQQSVSEGKKDYIVLLILTDGIIHDMQESIRLIVECSDLPMSIIIIGVGQAYFSDMETLDGDDGLIDSRGRKAQRDIVQFVQFKQFDGNDDLLQKQVLHELPDQIVEYHLMHKKFPQGFQSQPHQNYVQFTRMAEVNQTKQVSNPCVGVLIALIIVLIGVVIANLIL